MVLIVLMKFQIKGMDFLINYCSKLFLTNNNNKKSNDTFKRRKISIKRNQEIDIYSTDENHIMQAVGPAEDLDILYRKKVGISC